MQFDWLLFDLDETLMDFRSASFVALKKSFEEYDLPKDRKTIDTYHRVNRSVWKKFEQGKIAVETLIDQRMELFLEQLSVDHVRPSELNDYYLHQLALNSSYYPETENILAKLKKSQYGMAIVTNGLTRVQRYRWENTSLPHFFSHIFISQEIGKPKPSSQFFDHVHASIKRPLRHRVLVIGDNPDSDIKGANEFGYKSCWINRGDQSRLKVKCDYEISDLQDLIELLD
ncbi:MAG: YjjG family noncanonical pyrimidine nucleotidase [Saprospiraceae bacterium]|nr:YjjG family noncanonical pyrimidine nucleotidase [Saprospiraceae bacterium]